MKKLWLIVFAVLTFASSGLFVHFYERTDNLSLRYMLWKNGFYPYPSDIIPEAVLADRESIELIRGKSKAEVRKIFPDVYETAINEHQKIYDKELAGRDYLWLGKHGVIIFFKNGVADQISIMKG